MIEIIAAGDPKAFLEHIAADDDRRRVCGFPAIYTMLSVIDGAKGRLISYDSTVMDEERLHRHLCGNDVRRWALRIADNQRQTGGTAIFGRSKKTLLIVPVGFEAFNYGPGHPLRWERVTYAMELIHEYGMDQLRKRAL